MDHIVSFSKGLKHCQSHWWPSLLHHSVCSAKQLKLDYLVLFQYFLSLFSFPKHVLCDILL